MSRSSKGDYLPVAEFARLIKVSAITVRRWDKNQIIGKPHAAKKTSDNHRLYTMEQVDDYLKKLKRK